MDSEQGSVWYYLFKEKNFFDYFYFGCTGSSLLHGPFLVAESRGYSSLQCVGFSLQRRESLIAEHGLRSIGSIVVVHGLNCCVACGIFLDQGLNLCPHIGRQIPIH